MVSKMGVQPIHQTIDAPTLPHKLKKFIQTENPFESFMSNLKKPQSPSFFAQKVKKNLETDTKILYF
jgi:hypothetical protein